MIGLWDFAIYSEDTELEVVLSDSPKFERRNVTTVSKLEKQINNYKHKQDAPHKQNFFELTDLEGKHSFDDHVIITNTSQPGVYKLQHDAIVKYPEYTTLAEYQPVTLKDKKNDSKLTLIPVEPYKGDSKINVTFFEDIDIKNNNGSEEPILEGQHTSLQDFIQQLNKYSELTINSLLGTQDYNPVKNELYLVKATDSPGCNAYMIQQQVNEYQGRPIYKSVGRIDLLSNQ